MGRKKTDVNENTEVKKDGEIKLSPSEYFEKIKGLKAECDSDEFLPILEIAEKQLKQFTLLKQTEAARITTNYIKMVKKEIEIIKAGFTTYVLKEDVEKYMHKLADKCVFCCEIADYPRSIDEKVFKRIENHIDLFDHIYIVFTDYTQKVSKQIDKKTREKDPIMFGAINLDGSSRNYPVIGPRLYFIGDWVDEFCDLTLQEVIESFKNKEKREDIVKTVEIPETTKEFKSEVQKFNKETISNKSVEIVSTAEQIANICG